MFQGNQAVGADLQQAYGGAIEFVMEGDATISASRIVGNKVVLPTTPGTSSYAAGGIGAYIKNLTIQDTEISGNAANFGGGIEVYNNLAGKQGAADTSNFKLINSTVSGNSAIQSGGAMNIFANVAAQIINSTVTNNTAATTRTGGVRVANGVGLAPPTLTLASSILANSNATTADIGIGTTAMTLPFPVSVTNTLIESPDSNAAITGFANLIGVDPLVGPLGFYGGPTRTQPLSAGSPAINAGSNSLTLTNDQRGPGFPRSIGGTVDMGAFESSPATFIVTNNDDSGVGSLRAAVAAAIAAGPTNTVSFAPAVTGSIILTSGNINITGPLKIAGPGAAVLAIDGNFSSRIFAIAENVPDSCATPGSDFSVSISGLTLTNARRNANSSAGAMYSEKTLTLNAMVIRDSAARAGGGLSFNLLHPGQSLTVTNSQFINNVAMNLSVDTIANSGGGLRIVEQCATRTMPATVTIANSLISGNSAQPTGFSGFGGGIVTFSDADITIRDTRIVGNHVDIPVAPVAGMQYSGGGIYGRAKSLRIERSEISGNSADFGGGMRYYNDVSTLQTASTAMAVTVVNSTISGNVASATAGGMFLYGNVAVELDNTTLSDNIAAATRTGGILFSTGATSPVTGSNALAGTLKLVSSIVANSQTGPNDLSTNLAVVPTFTVDATNSLIETICPSPSCEITIAGSGNAIAVDPMLGPLTLNGGSTRTQALLVGSPAINAGSNPLALATDQRGLGFPRIVGAVADMGAYEYNPSVSPVLQGAKSRKVHGGAGKFDLTLSP